MERIDIRTFFKETDDIRGFLHEYSDPRLWRSHLREKLFKDRYGRSDLSQRGLRGSFDVHEGIFQRRWVGKQDWQEFLFSGVNCFLLRMDEHIPEPPTRTECYWISVARYGKDTVDEWIDSLPFKVRPSTPWAGTHGIEVLNAIRDSRIVGELWEPWLEKNRERVDRLG